MATPLSEVLVVRFILYMHIYFAIHIAMLYRIAIIWKKTYLVAPVY